jgi:two-component system, cell cycle response regulator DivK
MPGRVQVKSRVLLVEDDAWIRTFLCDVLSDAGYTVLEAADGRTGLRLAEQERPQLMLLDLAMPEFTGMDVLTELRRNAWARKLPVLILSAYANLLAVRRAGPVAGVLGKPVDVSELLLAIDHALNAVDG